MNRILSVDSKLISFLSKIGFLILIDIMWLIGCIPIVTIGASTTAMYYATVKTVRKERSYPVKEFWDAYKRTLGKATILTVSLLAVMALLFLNRRYIATDKIGINLTLTIVYDVLMVLTITISLYLFPVLSRFQMELKNIIGLAFVMVIRFLPTSIVITMGTILIIWLQIIFLPWPCVFVVPAAWCYFASFFMEKVLRAYTPKPAEDQDAWYYE